MKPDTNCSVLDKNTGRNSAMAGDTTKKNLKKPQKGSQGGLTAGSGLTSRSSEKRKAGLTIAERV